MRLETNKASTSSLTDSERRARIRTFIEKSSQERGNGILIDEMAAKVKHFENIYAVKSSGLEAALKSGIIEENEDIVQWIFAYNILKRSAKI